ncbi:DNA cytosine methyltransferase [Streptomyces rapamycinicus]|uniref:DNA (cytosine-5-)-methyltransferase n=2 Tax=Streptomyces rapamycinicus TaxID=1226757 RepID=A0A0A0NAY8_STRRN|nr:DNA cytosine methyltransferase [Streptomyces rapamycinicus]AGP51625.1 DNA methyltransferase [Streptomyces rapamycinicus NRRL 5491]MBB4785013.1 DNA (cytosine-5)-methyltransferase 1 [Streptomyces rapamycinicus]RLV79510.1 cytosine methyltransferase [Streptomyces rapamycinicus NRRL 5491]UTO65247.1 DNA cytosine methyltransferase [Streptomyces rapamycinicus]UTP33203.1 DNA cytosine methyltransferase [Streptomyces rapamycinicus NRRL 5491]
MTHRTVPPESGNISLCTGSGALDLAVEAVTGLPTVMVGEKDPAASRLLATRLPHARNLGDITAVDWADLAASLPRPEALTAGFPCQDISNAGPRGGIAGDRSGLWKTIAHAIRHLRPRIVFLENVAALRSRGLDVVAADLAACGYDARWMCLRAGDPEVGACHRRDRWFAIAYPAAENPHLPAGTQRRAPAPGQTQSGRTRAHAGGRSGLLAAPDGRMTLLPTPAAADGTGGPGISPKRQGGMNLRTAVTLLPTPTACRYGRNRSASQGASSRPSIEYLVRDLLPTPKASDGPHGGPNQRDRAGNYYLPGQAVRLDGRWVATNGTDYGPAIHRWEAVLGRPAPEPTEPGTKGNRRLSPAFVEWMMGADPGWVTSTDLGLSRSDQLKILGNGVVIHQAAHAYRALLGTLAPEAAGPAPSQLSLSIA